MPENVTGSCPSFGTLIAWQKIIRESPAGGEMGRNNPIVRTGRWEGDGTLLSWQGGPAVCVSGGTQVFRQSLLWLVWSKLQVMFRFCPITSALLVNHFCDLNCPRDLSLAKDQGRLDVQLGTERLLALLWRECAKERCGWVLRGICHVWRWCREGCVISRMGEEGERHSLAGWCWLEPSQNSFERGVGQREGTGSDVMWRKELGAVMVCEALRIPFSVWAGTLGWHTPKRSPLTSCWGPGGQCPERSNPLGSAFCWPFSSLTYLPALLRGMGIALCRDLSLYPDLVCFSPLDDSSGKYEPVPKKIFFGDIT